MLSSDSSGTSNEPAVVEYPPESMRPRATCWTVSCSEPSCELRKALILRLPLLPSSTCFWKRTTCISHTVLGGALVA